MCYGYFEVRARAMNSLASSAFWFYSRDPAIKTEIDIFDGETFPDWFGLPPVDTLPSRGLGAGLEKEGGR